MYWLVSLPLLDGSVERTWSRLGRAPGTGAEGIPARRACLGPCPRRCEWAGALSACLGRAPAACPWPPSAAPHLPRASPQAAGVHHLCERLQRQLQVQPA